MPDIEPADMDDLGELVDLWVALADGQRRHGSRVRPEASREAVRETLARHVFSGEVLVVRGGPDEAGLLGFVAFGPVSTTYERTVQRGVIRDLYVRPAARDRGVGSALLAAAERRLAADGAGEVVIEVLADNEAARRLYRRHGYRPHRMQLAKPLESDTHTSSGE